MKFILGAFRLGFSQQNQSNPIGSMYGIYANIGDILMVNVTIYTIYGSYGNDSSKMFPIFPDFPVVFWPSPGQILARCLLCLRTSGGGDLKRFEPAAFRMC